MDFSAGIAFFFGQLNRLLFSLGSHFSLTSLAAALIVSVLLFRLAAAQARPPRSVAHDPARAVSAPHRRPSSNQADIGYLFFNVFMFSMLFGWAILSYQFISNGIIAALVALAGPVTPRRCRFMCRVLSSP